MNFLNDPSFVKILEELIRDIVKKEIDNARFNKMISCKVVSADNVAKTATIELLNDGIQISNVKNRTNQDLSANDLCYCLFINGDNANFVLTIKN